MLHFLHVRTWDIEHSFFGQELERSGQAYRFIKAPANLRYQTMAGLILRVYPRLIWQLVGAALRSLAWSRPVPDVVVVSSDLEALIFGLVRTLLRSRTRIVFQTLIITPRRNRVLNALYLAGWRLILAVTDLGICHARAEVAAYAALFPAYAHKLQFLPYGVSIFDLEAMLQTPPLSEYEAVIVTAGRSGRDYKVLAQAIEGLPCRLVIICDKASALVGVPDTPQIEIARARFDREYIQTLAGATVVAIPLAIDDISAGQMVLLQAAALHRPVVITRTTTTLDYATDEADVLMVGLGDVMGWRTALTRLMADPALRTCLAEARLARYEREGSTEAYVRALLAAITARFGSFSP